MQSTNTKIDANAKDRSKKIKIWMTFSKIATIKRLNSVILRWRNYSIWTIFTINNTMIITNKFCIITSLLLFVALSHAYDSIMSSQNDGDSSDKYTLIRNLILILMVNWKWNYTFNRCSFRRHRIWNYRRF